MITMDEEFYIEVDGNKLRLIEDAGSFSGYRLVPFAVGSGDESLGIIASVFEVALWKACIKMHDENVKLTRTVKFLRKKVEDAQQMGTAV